MDWFINNIEEKRKLLKYLDMISSNTFNKKTFSLVNKDVKINDLKKYSLINEKTEDLINEKWYNKIKSDFVDEFIELLEKESPLQEEWLLRRIESLLYSENLEENLQKIFNLFKETLKARGITFKDGLIYK